MDIIFILLPISLMLAICGLAAFLWGVKTGQLDDLETPALKVLLDDEDEKIVNIKKSGED